MGRPEEALAVSWKGAAAWVASGRLGKLIVWVAGATVKVRVTVSAARRVESPGCAACTEMVPAPVISSLFPERVPGPEMTVRVTGRPELALAFRVKGAAP